MLTSHSPISLSNTSRMRFHYQPPRLWNLNFILLSYVESDGVIMVDGVAAELLDVYAQVC